MRLVIEAALAGLVIALLGGALAAVLLRRFRKRPSGATPSVRPATAPRPVPAGTVVRAASSVVCESCGREYPAGLRFCPHDAKPLAQPDDPAVRAVVVCPSCRRAFDARMRFCPFDGEELMTGALAQVLAGRAPAALNAHLRKICPSCAQHYEADATYCRRDGAELVSVN